MNPLIYQQFKDLQSIHSGSKIEDLEYGLKLVSIPDVKLPYGWGSSVVTVLFVIPPGYPATPPDCFWVEPVIRLADGRSPYKYNELNQIPHSKSTRDLTWFYWHLQLWNPNHDSLVTYFNVIMRRFDNLM